MFRLRVREVAEFRQMSRRQLFLRSGVDIRIVRKMFNDPTTVVTIETLAKLAPVLDVDVSQLIESAPPGKILSPDDLEVMAQNPLPQSDEPDSEEE